MKISKKKKTPVKNSGTNDRKNAGKKPAVSFKNSMKNKNKDKTNKINKNQLKTKTKIATKKSAAIKNKKNDKISKNKSSSKSKSKPPTTHLSKELASLLATSTSPSMIVRNASRTQSPNRLQQQESIKRQQTVKRKLKNVKKSSSKNDGSKSNQTKLKKIQDSNVIDNISLRKTVKTVEKSKKGLKTADSRPTKKNKNSLEAKQSKLPGKKANIDKQLKTAQNKPQKLKSPKNNPRGRGRRRRGHRLASLNASAKVKALCENDQNLLLSSSSSAVVDMAGQRRNSIITIKSDDEDVDDIDDGGENVINLNKKKSSKSPSKSSAKKSSNKNLKKSKLNDRLINCKKSKSANAKSKNNVKGISSKKASIKDDKKSKKKTKKKKKKRLKIDPDVEIIDTRRNKRMASLNASAMMAATFSSEKEQRLVLAKPMMLKSSTSVNNDNNNDVDESDSFRWSRLSHPQEHHHSSNSSTVEEHIETMTTVETMYELADDNTTVVKTMTTTKQQRKRCIEQQQNNSLNNSNIKKRKLSDRSPKITKKSLKKCKTKPGEMPSSTAAANVPPTNLGASPTATAPTSSAFTPCPLLSNNGPIIIPCVTTTTTVAPAASTSLNQNLIYQVPFTPYHHQQQYHNNNAINNSSANQINSKQKKVRKSKSSSSATIQQPTTATETFTNDNQSSSSSIMRKSYYRKIETRTVKHHPVTTLSATTTAIATTSNNNFITNQNTNYYYHSNTHLPAPPNGLMTFPSIPAPPPPPTYDAIINTGGGNPGFINSSSSSLIKPYQQQFNPNTSSSVSATVTNAITATTTTFGSQIVSSSSSPYQYHHPFSLTPQQPYSIYNPSTVATFPFQLIPFAGGGGNLFQNTQTTAPIFAGNNRFITPQPFIATAPSSTIYPYIPNNSPFGSCTTSIPAIGQFLHCFPTAATAIHSQQQPQPAAAAATASPFLGVQYVHTNNPIGITAAAAAAPVSNHITPTTTRHLSNCNYSSVVPTNQQSYLNLFTGNNQSNACPPTSSLSSAPLSSSNNLDNRLINPVSIHTQSGQTSSSSISAPKLDNTTRTTLNQAQIINLNGPIGVSSSSPSIPNVVPYGLLRSQSTTSTNVPASNRQFNFINSNSIPPQPHHHPPQQQQLPTFFVQTNIQPSTDICSSIRSGKKKSTMTTTKKSLKRNLKIRKNGEIRSENITTINGSINDNDHHQNNDNNFDDNHDDLNLNKSKTIDHQKKSLKSKKSRTKQMNKTLNGPNNVASKMNGHDRTLVNNLPTKKSSKTNNETTMNGSTRKLVLKNGINPSKNATPSTYPKRRSNNTNNINNSSSKISTNNGGSLNESNEDKIASISSSQSSLKTTNIDDSKEKQSQTRTTTNRSKAIVHGWSWEGESFENNIYINNEDQSYRRKCYSAIRHNEGEIIKPGDCVLLKSGPRKTDLPFVAKISSLWESPEKGMMMSLLWYYRPEHTEIQNITFVPGEIYASRHRDTNSVACIDDKCFVLTFNEYCRFKRQKLRQYSSPTSVAFLQQDLTSYIVPDGEPWSGDEQQSNSDNNNQSENHSSNKIQKRSNIINNHNNNYRNRSLPPLNTLPELVFYCRKVYDFRQKRILKNPSYESKNNNNNFKNFHCA